MEACECDFGYILDGTTCVPEEQCGCTVGGYYISIGLFLLWSLSYIISLYSQYDVVFQVVLFQANLMKPPLVNVPQTTKSDVNAKMALCSMVKNAQVLL